MYKRAVDLEAGSMGAPLLEEDGGYASSISEELSMRRSSSASPGALGAAKRPAAPHGHPIFVSWIFLRALRTMHTHSTQRTHIACMMVFHLRWKLWLRPDCPCRRSRGQQDRLGAGQWCYPTVN